MNQLTDQPINQPINQSINQSMYRDCHSVWSSNVHPLSREPHGALTLCPAIPTHRRSDVDYGLIWRNKFGPLIQKGRNCTWIFTLALGCVKEMGLYSNLILFLSAERKEPLLWAYWKLDQKGRLGKIYRQTDRQAGRQASRQAGRQAGRQADRQTDRQIDR